MSIGDQDRELILTSEGKMVGAVLTEEQYSWFLDKLDEDQDLGFIPERLEDRERAQSLEGFKEGLGE